jgi:hypothetical protein
VGERVQGRFGNFLNSQTDGEDLEQRLTERPLIAGGLETLVFSTELVRAVNVSMKLTASLCLCGFCGGTLRQSAMCFCEVQNTFCFALSFLPELIGTECQFGPIRKR